MSTKEQLEDIAIKNNDEGTNLAATSTNNDEPQPMDNTEHNSSKEDFLSQTSAKEILQEIDDIVDDQLPLSSSVDDEKDADSDNSLDQIIKNNKEPLESNKQALTSHLLDEDTKCMKILHKSDQTIDSDTDKVDSKDMVYNVKKSDVEKTISLDPLNNSNKILETNSSKLDTSEHAIKESVTDNATTKLDDDKSSDSLNLNNQNDGVNAAGAIESHAQNDFLDTKSDSNEDICLRWDDDDSDDQIQSNIDDDKEINNDEENKLLEDEDVSSGKTGNNECQNDEINPVNEELIDIEKKTTLSMEVDTQIPVINNVVDTNLNKEMPACSVKSIGESKSKMNLNLSLSNDGNPATKLVDEVDKNSEVFTENQPLKCPAEEKVDVNNPETAVKEYSMDLSIVTGVVNGPERNLDCHDLLQIKERSQDSLLEDSIVVINTDHGLNKPDMMLEIPTQELIDFDESYIDDNESMISETVDGNANEIEQQVSSVETRETSEKNEGTKGDPKPKNETIRETVEKSDAGERKEAVRQTKNQEAQDNSKKNITEIRAQIVTKSSDIQRVAIAIKDTIDSITKKIEDQRIIIDTLQKASTSTGKISTEMAPDAENEFPELSDSLGLLAESSRVVEDDEDDDDVFDDGDDEDDESSNQMTAEHSEDSNAPPSESDAVQSEAARGLSAEDKDRMDADQADCEESVTSTEVTTGGGCEQSDVTKVPVQSKASKATGQTQEINIVKLSDTSENEGESEADSEKRKQSVLRQLLLKSTEAANECSPTSPSKVNVGITPQKSNIVNIVDLEESSSEDDDQNEAEQTPEPQTSADNGSMMSVNIPLGVEVMQSGGGGTMSELHHAGDEVVISGVPKPPRIHRPARLNTGEVTIKTASTVTTLVIPEKKISDGKLDLEIFNIDSDEEDTSSCVKDDIIAPLQSDATEEMKEKTNQKCINLACKSDRSVAFVPANASTAAFFNYKRKRCPIVCQNCADMVDKRAQDLVDGIKQFTPILDLDSGKESHELVEISDSDSEDESEAPEGPITKIGEKGAKFLEENLANMLNETWKKFNMDERLQETQDLLGSELEKLEEQSKEIDELFNECQVATDKLRNELYATFEGEKRQFPALIIFDTPYSEFVLLEDQVAKSSTSVTRENKRRLSPASESAAPAKRPAIPLSYMTLDNDTASQLDINDLESTDIPMKFDDDRDISVVQLSAEAAPADLPAPGELLRAPIRSGMAVYAMRNAFGSWLKGKVLECQAKGTTSNQQFTMCRVKFDHKVKNPCKVLSARCLAYAEPTDVRMTIGTRVIALCRDSTNTGKKDSFYSGVVAEIPNPVNNYRYLVFFDDGYAQYVTHSDTRLVCECSQLVWEEVHPFSQEFVRDYLLAYPERPMVRLHAGQSIKTEWNGKWWVSRVVVVDASLVQVQFDEDSRVEWIYRGSTRLAPLYLELQAAERTRARPLPRTKGQARTNMPYVEYTRTDEQGGNKTGDQEQQQNEEMRRQRAVAKKSTATPTVAVPPNVPGNLDSVTSRVVYYTPKNAVRPLKMSTHTCGPKCKRTDVLALKDLRTYNPLAKPLLSGWERQIVRYKGQKEVMYRAPCGRRVRDVRELHAYLRAARSDMPVDLFDFHPNTHCLAEFVLNKCIVGKKDLSHGKENVPVPCVNYYDDSLPEFCSYNTERTPTAGVPLNLDPDFLCGCDCTDDCADKTKCACWKLTLEGARTIGLEGQNVGYSYKRLPEPLPSGIYECNSRCKCKHTCLNRVAQHPLQLKLQVFKTLNRGWGIRALNDVPKGSFLCVYAGNLLTDATANLDGLNEGDEYLAELDYIEVVEQMKEGFEEDIPDADKKLDKKESKTDGKASSSEEMSSDDDEDTPDKNDVMDDDFSPGYIGPGITEFSKRLRRRGKGKKGEKEEDTDKKEELQKDGNGDDECITISDDEEVRQPSRFTAQAGMGANEFVPKYKSVRAHFGKDEACYIMDAKVQGNIGRYLNHSCSPNVFVQNVFVDTHDPRFPWVAFFALSHIRAGTELTWNYNYDIGSVPEKVLYCYCGAPNCRRRLL